MCSVDVFGLLAGLGYVDIPVGDCIIYARIT